MLTCHAVQGISQTPDMQQDVSGLPLGLALGVALYFNRERKLSTGSPSRRFSQNTCYVWLLTLVLYAGKVVGFVVAGAVAGSILGGALQSWLRVDIVPVAVSTSWCLCLCNAKSVCRMRLMHCRAYRLQPLSLARLSSWGCGQVAACLHDPHCARLASCLVPTCRIEAMSRSGQYII